MKAESGGTLDEGIQSDVFLVFFFFPLPVNSSWLMVLVQKKITSNKNDPNHTAL